MISWEEADSGELDLQAVSADDALLTAVACDAASVGGAALAGALSDWRRELDHAADATPSAGSGGRHLALAGPAGLRAGHTLTTTAYGSRVIEPLRSVTACRPRGVGLRRGVTAGFVAVTMLAGGGVAAAAVSGPHGPLGGLHRALFGEPTHSGPTVVRVQRLLARAQHDIDRYRAEGGISLPAQRHTAALLDEAGALLAGKQPPERDLLARLAQERSELAALPLVASIGSPTSTTTAQHLPAKGSLPARSSHGGAVTGGGPSAAEPTGALPRSGAAPAPQPRLASTETGDDRRGSGGESAHVSDDRSTAGSSGSGADDGSGGTSSSTRASSDAGGTSGSGSDDTGAGATSTGGGTDRRATDGSATDSSATSATDGSATDGSATDGSASTDGS